MLKQSTDQHTRAGLFVASDGLKGGPRAVGTAIGRRRAVACAHLIERAAAARGRAGRGIGPCAPATSACTVSVSPGISELRSYLGFLIPQSVQNVRTFAPI
jgi:hypothetical protein